MSREDLKEIDEFLDQGEGALIVVAATDVEDRVRGLMAAADATTQERIDANVSQLDAEISAASESQSSGAQGSGSQRSGSQASGSK